ncbi:TIR domain-containing protein [Parafrankia sp. EUN1f]|uniref:NB-ARC domain-containing protein n=1 Tax=Parafrankia sp. EUN1f TaxID=102897 RepID=UPI0012F96844|nr:TIR domain-containing protein [Parafrankia sp. EUN1f]
MSGGPYRWDFYVSCADEDKDKKVGEWVAWHLENGGRYKVQRPEWGSSGDSLPAGTDWSSRVKDAVRESRITVALVSDAYLTQVLRAVSDAFDADPDGATGRLLPVRIEDCPPTGLLAGIIPVNLTNLLRTQETYLSQEEIEEEKRKREADARDLLFKAASQVAAKSPARPTVPPQLPGRRMSGSGAAAGAPHQPAPKPVVWLPALVGTEVRRPELAERLVGMLTAESEEPLRVVALHGGPGFGKTTLAKLVCHRDDVRAAFPGGLLWTSLGQDHGQLTGKINALVVRLAQELGRGSQEPLPSEPEQAGMRLGELLDALPPERRTLLVIDDVWSAAQLGPFLSGGSRCTRLVTTRDQRTLTGDPSVVWIDMMRQAEARELLVGAAPDLPATVADRLARLCGSWPLLLDLAAKNLRRRVTGGAPATEAAEELIKGLEDAGVVAFDDPVGDEKTRDRAVEATVEASLRLLNPPGSARGHLLDRFLELAVFPAETAIDLAVLEKLWGHTAGWGAWQVRQFRDVLVDLSLLVPAGKGDLANPAGSPWLHDVLHRYLDRRIGKTLPGLHRRLLEAFRRDLPAAEGRTAWWHLSDTPGSDYLVTHLIYHLLAALQTDEAAAVATDPRWIEVTLRRTSSTMTAEHDLASVGTGHAVILARALAQNAHVVAGPALPGGVGPTLAATLAAVPTLASSADEYCATIPRPCLGLVWSTQPAQHALLRTIRSGAGGSVNAVAFSADGRLLAAGGGDGTVRLWSPATGTELPASLAHGEPVSTLAGAPAGQVIAVGGTGGAVRLWDPVARTNEVLAGHERGVTAVAFSPDGKLLVTAGYDEKVRLRDLAANVEKPALVGLDGWVNAVAFSPDGKLLATAGYDGTVRLWNPATGERQPTSADHRDAVNAVAYATDGHLIAFGGADGSVRLWDPAMETNSQALAGAEGSVAAVAFSPDGSLLAASGDRKVRLWEPEAGADPITTLAGHSLGVAAVAFSPDGSLLASGGAEGTVRLWDPRASAARDPVAGLGDWMTAVAFSRQGLLATGGADGAVQLWDPVRGTPIRTPFTGHCDMVTAVAFSPDGQFLAAAGRDQAILWDRENGGEPVATLAGPGRGEWVTAVAFDPDGRFLAVAGRDQAILWDRENRGGPVATFAVGDEWVTAVGFSPDGQLLATASSDRTIRLWDPADATEPTRTIDGHGHGVTAMAFSPDGSLLATADQDATVRLWDPEGDGGPITLAGHTDWVTAVAFSPDGRYLATASRDQTVRLWDKGEWEAAGARTSLRLGVAVTALAWHDDSLCCATELGLWLLRCHRLR